MTTFLSIVFLMICALLILIILIQRGRGGGLTGAFGGGGGGGTAFGTKTGDVFTTVTVVLFAFFLITAIVLNYKFKDIKSASIIPAVNQATAQPASPSDVPLPTTAPTSAPDVPSPVLPEAGPSMLPSTAPGK